MPHARFRFLPTLAVVLPAVALAGCGDPTYTWHQKMTVEVETPAGVKSSSSVIEVSAQVGSGFLAKHTAGSPVGWKTHGEAVTVDLGNGRYLFALLTGDKYRAQPGRNALYSFADMASYDPPYDTLPVDQVERAPRNRSVAIAADSYPLLVTFTDLANPKTVRRVNPDNLAATFGPGYDLKAVKLEITDAPVTSSKIESVLPWIGDYYNKMLDGRGSSTIKAANRLANDLSAGAFDTIK
jgi:hypothetical protein